jgi:hypothetical protein
VAGYGYYLGRRIAMRRALAKVYYRYRLYDHPVRAVAKGIADRLLVRFEAVRADLRRA